MATIDPFGDCDLPPVLFGTGTLYIVSGGDEINLGNFSLVDFTGESETRRVFLGADEIASPLVTTAAYRLELTGDSFSDENLSRLLNEPLGLGMTGTEINLTTVRSAPTYRLRFEKELPPTEAECPNPRFINLHLWRCYIDAPFFWTFSQDEQTVHRFVFITIPDPVNWPDNPLGMITKDF